MDDQKFHFRFLGRHGEWFAFRAPTWKTAKRNALDACIFENGTVAEWLLEEVDGDDFHMGNGDAPGMPDLPFAFENGAAACLLLKNPADVIRFSETFDVTNLNPRTLLESMEMKV